MLQFLSNVNGELSVVSRLLSASSKVMYGQDGQRGYSPCLPFLLPLCLFLPVVKESSPTALSQRRVPAQLVFSGHMKLEGMQYNQLLEDPTSAMFSEQADNLEEIVSGLLPPAQHKHAPVNLTLALTP